jgi:hypothetical protein
VLGFRPDAERGEDPGIGCPGRVSIFLGLASRWSGTPNGPEVSPQTSLQESLSTNPGGA